MKSVLVLLVVRLALIASPLFALSANASEAHCEGMVRGEYMTFFVNANPAAVGTYTAKLTYRDSAKSPEDYTCVKGADSQTHWYCEKTTSAPGTLQIKVVPTIDGDWAELFVGSNVKNLFFSGTLDCRFFD